MSCTRHGLLRVGLTLLLAIPLWSADVPARERVAALEVAGEFAQAEALLAETLARTDLDPASRPALEWERERLHRIRLDYPHTRETLFTALEKAVGGLTRVEFDRWLEEGRFDAQRVDGELRFFASSVSNLFFRHPELRPRRLKPADSVALQRALLTTARTIQEAARESGTPYVRPRRFQIRMRVTVKPGVVRAGESVRCWLPVPREYPFQDGFELLDSEPAGARVGPANAVLRAALLEQVAPSAGEVKFQLDYTYATRGVCFDLDPGRVTPADATDPALTPFLAEAPHVVFTEAMRSLATSIAGRETNPVRRARKYYEWIARNIRYSFAREYSTIPNLGAYCLEHRYGDCGQEAFLFITLCRLSGIPARWQSGWSLFPGAETIHDWCEIHLAPYGWVPVDPYMGIYATQYTPALSPRERRVLRDFYFGGLDPFRLIANAGHNQVLAPEKRSFRSDPVDFQRGEVEAGGRNVYFGQFSYDLEWKPVPLAGSP
jgi:transglutaminase-like putative cysteine protease